MTDDGDPKQTVQARLEREAMLRYRGRLRDPRYVVVCGHVLRIEICKSVSKIGNFCSGKTRSTLPTREDNAVVVDLSFV